MRKATFFYLLRRGLLTGAGGFIRDGLVMASKFITQGLTHPAQGSAEFDGASDYIELPNDIITDTDNYTLGAWYYFDTQVSNDSILSFGNSTTDTPLINLETINAGASIRAKTTSLSKFRFHLPPPYAGYRDDQSGQARHAYNPAP